MKKLDDENDKVLKDKQVLSVPLMMMDSRVRREVGDILSAGPRRPHQMSFSDATNKERETRQRAYDKRLGDAWRNPFDVASHDTRRTPTASEHIRAYDHKIANAWRNPQ